MPRFTRSSRLLKPTDFTRVRKRGKRASSPSFVVYMFKQAALVEKVEKTEKTEEARIETPQGGPKEEPRLGLSVSSRVGNAVRRNRFKRLLREYFRLNREKFPRAIDVLIVVKDGAVADSLDRVASELSLILTASAEGTGQAR